MTGYTIDEAASRMGVTKHTLRYYEREGLLPPIAKASSGHRRYTDDDLGWVRTLQLLRGTGMPIREMKDFVELTRAGDHTVAARVEVLRRYREELRERMTADVERMDFLNHKIGIYADMLAARDATPEDVTGGHKSADAVR
ncbi:MAG: MerR family transcriptional regulator [Demequinaceae bacterium]|nr:MerR family transcriptional regulator [Demequinaceae bacterium]